MLVQVRKGEGSLLGHGMESGLFFRSGVVLPDLEAEELCTEGGRHGSLLCNKMLTAPCQALEFLFKFVCL